MAILFHCPWDNADAWLAALQHDLPHDEFRIWPDLDGPDGDASDIDFAFVWKLPHGVLASLPTLVGIASLGAGVDALLGDPDLPRDVPITRLVDPLMTDRMAEYVTATVLHHHLGLDVYDRQGAEKQWQRNRTTDAPDRTVALFGLGQMGERCAQRLRALGFDLVGWSRTAKEISGVHCLHGAEGFEEALAAAEIAVLLLPLTAETENLMNAAAFAAMPQGAYVINCSRGEVVVNEDLIAALDSAQPNSRQPNGGHLAGATLDAFAVEPLAPDSPLWTHPKIRITPHIAALSAAATAAPILAAQVRRARDGEAMHDVVNVDGGY